jgi:hypothetical protein
MELQRQRAACTQMIALTSNSAYPENAQSDQNRARNCSGIDSKGNKVQEFRLATRILRRSEGGHLDSARMRNKSRREKGRSARTASDANRDLRPSNGARETTRLIHDRYARFALAKLS